MSTTIIDDPSYLEVAQPKRLSAVSPFVKLVLGFGFLWGLIIGIIGQFVFRAILEQELLRSQTISIAFSQQLILIELIYLCVALILAFIVLAFVWKAPSRNAAILTSMSIGLVFGLTCHTVFLGAINGAIYNRDSWIFLHQNFSNDDAAFVAVITSSVVNSLQEGMAFGLLTLVLLSVLGALAGLFIPLDSSTGRKPGKDAFGAFAAAFFAFVLLETSSLNLIIMATMSNSIGTAASETGQSIDTDLLMASHIVPPLLAGVMALLIAIYWAWRVDLETVHRKMLRISQICMAIVGGIVILSLSLSYMPELWENTLSRNILILIMGLSWLYAVILQLRLQSFKVKSEQFARADNLSLAFAGFSVLILSYLLLDFFGIRAYLNLIMYPVALIPDGLQDTANPAQRVSEILYTAITLYWSGIIQAIGLYTLIGMAIYQPIAWLANKFER
jgi:hypothetical protein